MTEIVVPANLWDPGQEGSLLTWIYPNGAQVEEGDTIAEVIVEKSQFEITAPASGSLTHELAEGDSLFPGHRIGAIG